MDLEAIKKALNFLRPIIEIIEEVLDLPWDHPKRQEIFNSLCKRQYEIMSAVQVLRHNLFPEATTLPGSVDIDGGFITPFYAVYQILFRVSKIYLDEEYFLDEEDSVS